MNRTGAAIVGLCLLGSVACGRDRDDALETPATVLGDDNLARPRVVIIEGCLTEADDRFVLTDLQPGAVGPRVARREGTRPGAEAQPTTETYRLVGLEAQLRPLVGQRVEVTGSAEPEKVIEVRESSPPHEPRNASATATTGIEPRISTVQTTRLEIADLQVNSVAASGESCRSSR